MTPPTLIIPRPLRRGSRIAIVSPAGRARVNNVESAVGLLAANGFEPIVQPHALGVHGSFSASISERLESLGNALTDPGIDAVICSRGGYGAVHLLDDLDRLPLRSDPKWVVGFSDITAIHGLMARHRIASIHGPMAKHISAENGHSQDFQRLLRILQGDLMDYHFEAHPYNRAGSVTAPLLGGNLAVASGLIATPFDMLRRGSILFIEDISEPIYKVERQLYQLRMSGVLPRLAGLLVGQFTNYTADANYSEMETMIRDMVDRYNYPVAFNIPAGHGGRALPLIMGPQATLTVATNGQTHLQSAVNITG